MTDLTKRYKNLFTTGERLILTQQIIEVDRQISEVNAVSGELKFKMDSYPVMSVRGKNFHGNNVDDENTFQMLRAQRDEVLRHRSTQLVPTRDTLKWELGTGPMTTFDTYAERLDAAAAALSATREAVQETAAAYEAVEKEDKIKKALASVGQLKLGGSERFSSDVSEFNRIEELMKQVPRDPRSGR